METISYKLPDFEGPLDLLLFLVQKNKLNIYDIPISQVLEQYLAAIQQMKEELTAQGVKVLENTFVCSGKGGLFGGKHPSEEELAAAGKWAKECEAKLC